MLTMAENVRGREQTLNPRDLEESRILDPLEKTAWRIMGAGGATEIMGMKRMTLQARMKKLGIKRPDARWPPPTIPK